MSNNIQNYSDAYSLSQKYDGVQYGFGSKNPEKGKVDCSGWVIYLQNSDMKHVNEFVGKEIFTKKDYFNSSIDAASEIIRKSELRSGLLFSGKLSSDNTITKDMLKEGMIIGEDNGDKKWDRGRHKGIDHIVQVVKNPDTGELMISQSRAGYNGGVTLTSVENYLEGKRKKGTSLYLTDPIHKAREAIEQKINELKENRKEDSDTLKKGKEQTQSSADRLRYLIDGLKNDHDGSFSERILTEYRNVVDNFREKQQERLEENRSYQQLAVPDEQPEIQRDRNFGGRSLS